MFTAMEWSSFGIQPAKIFHLADRILEEKTPHALLTMAQTTFDPSTTKDPEEIARRQAKLAVEAIAFF